MTTSSFREPRFYGWQARAIRRHYAWLRKRLGERKLLRVIRKVKDTERKKINTLYHQISHAIVEQAKGNNAIIVYCVVLSSEQVPFRGTFKLP